MLFTWLPSEERVVCSRSHYPTNLSFTFKLNILFASSSAEQLDELEAVKSCQSCVYWGGTCYQEAAGQETPRRVAGAPGATRTWCVWELWEERNSWPGKSEGRKNVSQWEMINSSSSLCQGQRVLSSILVQSWLSAETCWGTGAVLCMGLAQN